MKVKISYRFWSLVSKADINNEAGETIMSMKGKLFSPTRKKRIYDKDGNLLYIVRNRFWFNWIIHKTYIYDSNKKKIATLCDNASLKNEYIVKGYQDEIKINGNFASSHFDIIANDEKRGSINRLDLRSDVSLEADEQYIPFFSALVVAINTMTNRKENNT